MNFQFYWNKINSDYFRIKVTLKYILLLIINRFYSPKELETKDIPIIINNRNRLEYLEMLIHSLEERGYYNIYIIDNASTYPPLLDYYTNKCQYKVFRLNENVGYTALWDMGLIKQFRGNYFVYTDSDVVLADSCPKNILQVLLDFLKTHPNIHKVGPALEINDLPEYNKARVLKTELKFWKCKISENPPAYKACIDTTFALHRPWAFKHMGIFYSQIRVGYPYVAKHMPWYEDLKNLSNESLFYRQNVNMQSTWYTNQ